MMKEHVSELDKIDSEYKLESIGGKMQILFIVVGIVIGFLILRGFVGGGEDNWIKDSKGVYVPHGHPRSVPDNVKAQHDAIDCGLKLLMTQKPTNGYNSECLGLCKDYAVDIVHNPRNADDDKSENQCLAYIEGQVENFIELDASGNVVRIG